MVRMIALVLALALIAMPAFAGPNKGAASANKGTSTGEKLVDHTVDAAVDVLTGDNSSKTKSTGSLPPGLAKKGKTPPGWSKGNKEGWDKEPEKKDSPIKSFFKGLFGQK